MTPNCLCLRCSHQWTSRVEKPVECPRCKSHHWNEPWKRKPKVVVEPAVVVVMEVGQ